MQTMCLRIRLHSFLHERLFFIVWNNDIKLFRAKIKIYRDDHFVGLHGGVVASTVASQQEGRGFNSRSGQSFCVEFACSPRGSVGSLRVLWLPPTVQRHAAG